MRRKVERHEFKPKPHPSGKPAPTSNYVALGFRRHVHDEPLTPGLRRRDGVPAIGFTARLTGEE